ncbi:Inositol-pentakisphosphate 2-kinase [Penicillium brevicompactum]|uniref:Inositol-pentakisphosphate 2-kinase n=1 Tax=Penicillium brevicompactum TaxID=5074 RepID=A0A9W9R4Z2_PENBR|nr:Inositol-pentakisphosphate 2-kinase [Penicillium brevicompactum]
MTKPSLLELPTGVQLIYLAEGGANVIYRFVNTNEILPPQLQGKLLRLRKQTAADITYKEIARNFDTIIRPLFKPDELVDQTLIRLPESLLARRNEQLRAAERNGQRPKKRHGTYLCLNEPFGLLVTDMTADKGSTLAELKPKWLNQSPSAPPTAHRCRTCALREMKNHASLLPAKEQRSFCPLDLVSEQYESVLRATGLIQGCTDRSRLAHILFRNPTLLRLQSLQKTEREVGLLGPLAQSREMSLAMTLRDCTMFVKIPHDEGSPVEIRLGDLDLKTGAGGKAGYWRDLEAQLIEQDWYRGSTCGHDSSECALHLQRSLPRPA